MDIIVQSRAKRKPGAIRKPILLGMRHEWQRTLLAALACLLLGYAHGSSRLDRLAGAMRDFVALYERSVDLKGMSVNDRIRFRELRRELDRLARETGP